MGREDGCTLGHGINRQKNRTLIYIVVSCFRMSWRITDNMRASSVPSIMETMYQ